MVMAVGFLYENIFLKPPPASAGGEYTGSLLHIRRKREASLSSLIVTRQVLAVIIFR